MATTEELQALLDAAPIVETEQPTQDVSSLQALLDAAPIVTEESPATAPVDLQALLDAAPVVDSTPQPEGPSLKDKAIGAASAAFQSLSDKSLELESGKAASSEFTPTINKAMIDEIVEKNPGADRGFIESMVNWFGGQKAEDIKKFSPGLMLKELAALSASIVMPMNAAAAVITELVTTGKVGQEMDAVGSVFNFLSGTMVGDAPSKVVRKLASPENERALDMLHKQIQENKSALRVGTEVAGGVAAAIATGGAASGINALASVPKVVKFTAGVAGVQAAMGYANATDETELANAAFMGTVGALLPLGFKVVKGTANIPKYLSSASDTVKQKVFAQSPEEANAAVKVLEDAVNQRVVKLWADKEPEIDAFAQSLRTVMVGVDPTKPEKLVQGLMKMSPNQPDVLTLSAEKALELQQAAAKTALGNFLEFVGAKTKTGFAGMQEDLQGWIAREGEEKLQSSLKQWKQLELAREDYVADAAAKAVSLDTRRGFKALGNWFYNAGRGFFGAESILAHMDDKIGSNLGNRTQAAIGAAKNKLATVVLESVQLRLNAVQKAAEEAGLDGKMLTSLVEGTTPLDKANKLQVKAVDLAKAYLEEERTLANSRAGREMVKQFGLRTEGKVAPYVPHATLKGTDLILAFENQFKKVLQVDVRTATQAGKPMFNAEEWEYLVLKANKGDKEAADLFHALEWVAGKKFTHEPEKGLMLAQMAAREALEGSSAMRGRFTKAAATFAREGEIPTFMREFDYFKLAEGWVYNTNRHIFLDPHIASLRQLQTLAEQRGMTYESNYVQNLVGDLTTGPREGAFARIINDAKRDTSLGLKRAYEATSNPFKKTLLKTAIRSPHLFGLLAKSPYVNFLANPKSLITNLAQPLSRVAPELGPFWGNDLMLNAYKEVAMDYKKFHTILKESGYISPDIAHTRAWDEATAELSKFSKAAITKAEDISSMALWGFKKSEEINKMVAVSMADQVVESLFANSTKSANFLKTVPSGWRSSIAQEVLKGNKKEAQRLMRDMLIQRTVFFYDSAHSSAFARAVGPTFSMFTKWPSAVAGDIWYQFASQPIGKASLSVMGKYLAPLGYLFALQSGINVISEEVLGKRKAEELNKTLFGRGLQTSAPVTSPLGILTSPQSLFTPPLLQPAIEVAGAIPKATTALIEGKAGKAGSTLLSATGRALLEGGQTFVPIAPAVLRMIETDIPALTLQGGKLPRSFKDQLKAGMKRPEKIKDAILGAIESDEDSTEEINFPALLQKMPD